MWGRAPAGRSSGCRSCWPVTHFTEETERLCDRIAVIDAGRVAALDTPFGLIAEAESRVRLRPSAPFPDALLTDLPEVTACAALVIKPGQHGGQPGTGQHDHQILGNHLPHPHGPNTASTTDIEFRIADDRPRRERRA